jgi:hypothetical protein
MTCMLAESEALYGAHGIPFLHAWIRFFILVVWG